MSSESTENPRERARQLMEQKSDIEAELEVHIDVLKANNATMETQLVDREGFPRADMDIYAVRGARKRIIELRNDLKASIEEIGKVLELVYALPPVPESGADGAGKGKEVEGMRTEEAEQEDFRPFARVDGVAPQSPASDAGLQREDLIVRFGGLSHNSFSSGTLQPLVTVVSANENRPISIEALRSGETRTLSLTPRSGWGGKGMLGCHIVPYSSPS